MDPNPIERLTRSLGDGLRALLADPWCERCRREFCSGPGPGRPRVPSLCSACNDELPWIRRPGLRDGNGNGRLVCRSCQEATSDRRSLACGPCLADPSLGALSSCTAGVAFEGAVRDLVHSFKYPEPGLAGLANEADLAVIAFALRAALLAPEPLPARIAPIPLHPRRLRQRGFNPAAVLARAIGKALRVPVSYDALLRTRDTPSQTGLGRAGRRSNVSNAFEVDRRALLRTPRGFGAARQRGPAGRGAPVRVWLIDDVVTTGATLAAAASALRRAGVREVAAVCAARTLRASDSEGPLR